MTRLRWLLLGLVLTIAPLAILWAALRPGPGSPAPVESPTAATASPARAGLDGPSPAGSGTLPTASGSSAGLSLVALLDLLPVRPEDRTGYDRSLFVLWIDADVDGCDTRREVLIDEAIVPPIVSAGCRLRGGRWHSLYDGFETTNPATFDIDHLVPLAEAWDSGASSWTRERRTRFANDLDVPWALLAVSAASNRVKSDRDPADWMPPLSEVRCTYVAAWLAVKVRWDLAIDPREHDVLAPIAGACRDTMPVVPAP